MDTPSDVQLKPLAPLARTIADTVRNTPVRLGTPEGAADLVAVLTVKVAAYMGTELGPDARILGEIVAERTRQQGQQNCPDGTGNKSQQDYAEQSRKWCEAAFGSGYGTWSDVLAAAVAEANAERDSAKLRAELVQVAAITIAWIAAIDERLAARPASS
ncbi:NUDIX hydrolase [Streptomyces sp. BBFR109]|uniref:NUDIX hydrolase n=1 Tax=Streptomyces sp. BBFR109 TaxID=3448172 RepID=UPI003F766F53